MSDPASIFQWRRFDARLTTSGQPSEAQLGEIAALGVRHVVNLGLHSHPKALADEGASVAALGMEYAHLPVDFDAPTEDDFTRFRSVMDGLGDQPVHVHCIANLRVTAFLARYFRETGGQDNAAALMDSVWRPGGVWAAFLGNADAVGTEHRYRGRDYP